MTASVTRWACLLGLAAALSLSGCTTMAKQAFYEFRGAKGSIHFIQPGVEPELFTRFRAVRFEPVTTSIGPYLCPPKLRGEYDDAARELETKLKEYYPGGEPGLTVSGEILYFQRKGIMSGAECLSRVRFTEDGDLVADAIVHVESKSFREGGTSALAETSVQTVGKLLKQAQAPEEEDADEQQAEGEEED